MGASSKSPLDEGAGAGLAPGVLAALAAAAAALAAVRIVEVLTGEASPVSAVLVAVLFGALLRTALRPLPRFDPGAAFVSTRILRLGVVLVGLRLSLTDGLGIAAVAAPVVIACMAGVGLAAVLARRLFGLDLRTTVLLGFGTAICGCTAVAAAASVIRADRVEIGRAVLCVVVLGVIGMMVYPPVLHDFLGLSATQAGIVLGTAIHDTSQVVGSGLLYTQVYGSPETLEYATVTKLLRNAALALLLPALALSPLGAQDAGAAGRRGWRDAVPLFVAAFVAMAALRNLADLAVGAGIVDPAVVEAVLAVAKPASEILLVCGMAAIGLTLPIGQLRHGMAKPLAAAGLIAATALAVSIAATSTAAA